jgi:hypothetical protein
MREHLVMAERLLREGVAVKDSEGVEIELRYRHAAFLAYRNPPLQAAFCLRSSSLLPCPISSTKSPIG